MKRVNLYEWGGEQVDGEIKETGRGMATDNTSHNDDAECALEIGGPWGQTRRP